jgi:phosphatidylserine decarboxylase
MAVYAWLEILLVIVFGGGLSVVAGMYAPWLLPVPLAITAFLLWFYRDPPRRPPHNPRMVVSPADGKIVGITRLPAEGDNPARLQITIFLSVFDVHVNRAPCAAMVAGLEYRRGRFVNALRDDSSHLNEQNELTLKPAAPLPGPILVRQIAGLLARRIVCTARAGDSLAVGQRYGMIKLGSRTELVVPDAPGWTVRVELNQRVKGGSTILLEWNGGLA